MNVAYYIGNDIEKPLLFNQWLISKMKFFLPLFFTLGFGIWGLIVTYNVLKQQKTQIVSFDEFLVELTDSLQRLLIKSHRTKKTYNVYLYDYHPLIGNLSAKKRFKEYESVLKNILNTDNIHISLITNHQDDLALFFQKLSIDDDSKIAVNSYNAINFIKSVEYINPLDLDKENSNSMIWKSNDISEFHFVLIDDEAYQYVVLPEMDNKNSIYGLKSEDPFINNYLMKSFNEKLKDIISPNKISYNSGHYYFEFEPQSNIENVTLYYQKNNVENTICTVSTLNRYNEIDINGFSIKEDKITHFPFYYKLRKKGHKEDVNIKSRNLYYRELLSTKPQKRSIKYINPTCEPKGRLKDCVDNFIIENQNNTILLANIFYDNNEYTREEVVSSFSVINPEIPINFIAQIPETRIAVELTITDNSFSVEYGLSNNFKYSIIETNSTKEYYLSSQKHFNNGKIYDNIDTVFTDFCLLLTVLGLTYEDVIRQWNFVGDILHQTKVDGSYVDNYNEFCSVREIVFKNASLNKESYPVATGIGINETSNFILSALAIKENVPNTINKIPLRIDFQEDPDKYSPNVRIGKGVPLFQRGRKVYLENDFDYYFISGTSSIIKEISHIDEAHKNYSQVKKTVEGIVDLFKTEENKILSLRNMSYIRIYYSGKEDKALEILKTFLYPIIKDVPHIYLQTDICRGNLHVEIEATKY